MGIYLLILLHDRVFTPLNNCYHGNNLMDTFCQQLREDGDVEEDWNERCNVKSFINPSQKSPTKANQAWVMVKPDGTMVTVHCTCMAG